MSRAVLLPLALVACDLSVATDALEFCPRQAEAARAEARVGDVALAEAAARHAPAGHVRRLTPGERGLALHEITLAVDIDEQVAFLTHTLTADLPACGPAVVHQARVPATASLDGGALTCRGTATIELSENHHGTSDASWRFRCEVPLAAAPGYQSAWEAVEAHEGGPLVDPRLILYVQGDEVDGTVELALAYDGTEGAPSVSSAGLGHGTWGTGEASAPLAGTTGW